MRDYNVSVACRFEATSPEDAVRQMIAWLDECAWAAGYRVTDQDDEAVSVFIDAERIA